MVHRTHGAPLSFLVVSRGGFPFESPPSDELYPRIVTKVGQTQLAAQKIMPETSTGEVVFPTNAAKGETELDHVFPLHDVFSMHDPLLSNRGVSVASQESVLGSRATRISSGKGKMRRFDYDRGCRNHESRHCEAKDRSASNRGISREFAVRGGPRCSRRFGFDYGVATRHFTRGSRSVTEGLLPYGAHDLVSKVVMHSEDPDQIQCFVRGCSHFVRRPTRHRSGTPCPDHGIYCHHSNNRSTYSYVDVTRNIIASPEMFAKWVIGHPFKYESDRFGVENSEDALSWNVFRSLQLSLIHI